MFRWSLVGRHEHIDYTCCAVRSKQRGNYIELHQLIKEGQSFGKDTDEMRNTKSNISSRGVKQFQYGGASLMLEAFRGVRENVFNFSEIPFPAIWTIEF